MSRFELGPEAGESLWLALLQMQSLASAVSSRHGDHCVPWGPLLSNELVFLPKGGCLQFVSAGGSSITRTSLVSSCSLCCSGRCLYSSLRRWCACSPCPHHLPSTPNCFRRLLAHVFISLVQCACGASNLVARFLS